MKKKVLLIGLGSGNSAVFRSLLDAGHLPTLQQLMDTGVMAGLTALTGAGRPEIWTSIATGRMASCHGIISDSVTDPRTLRSRRTCAADRRCHAIWNVLHHLGKKSVVCNWPVTHPVDPADGLMVSDAFAKFPLQPAPENCIFPAGHDGPLRDFRLEREDVDGALIGQFVPRLNEVDQENDPRLGLLATRLSELLDAHVAATYALEQVDWDFAAVCYPVIDAITEEFGKYSSHFHAARLDFDAEIFGEIWTRVWEFYDSLVARLIQLAGPDAFVMLVSPYGLPELRGGMRFLAHEGADGARRWNEQSGMLLLAGPGLQRDVLIHGAGVHDIVPTILALLELPIAADLDGRALLEAFEEMPVCQSCPSWEDVAGDFGRGAISSPDAGPEASGPMKEAGALQLSKEKWEKAKVFLRENRVGEALPILDELFESEPEQDEYARTLAQALLHLGLIPEAAEVISLLELPVPGMAALLLRAELELRRHHKKECAAVLDKIAAWPGITPLQLTFAGLIALGLRDTARAEALYGACLVMDPAHPLALSGLASCRVRQRRYPEARELASKSLSLTYSNFYGHYCLGLALSRLDRPLEAIQSLQTAARLNPGFTPAWRHLANLCKKHLPAGGADAETILYQQGAGRARNAAQQESLRAKLENDRLQRAQARKNEIL